VARIYTFMMPVLKPTPDGKSAFAIIHSLLLPFVSLRLPFIATRRAALCGVGGICCALLCFRTMDKAKNILKIFQI